MNWHNYNSYVVIHNYVFTTQLKFNVRIYKIRENRYNVVNLSSLMFNMVKSKHATHALLTLQ